METRHIKFIVGREAATKGYSERIARSVKKIIDAATNRNAGR